MNMKDLLISEIKLIQEDIKTLFLNHSQIYYENYSGGGILVVAPDYHFIELDEAGKKLQAGDGHGPHSRNQSLFFTKPSPPSGFERS